MGGGPPPIWCGFGTDEGEDEGFDIQYNGQTYHLCNWYEQVELINELGLPFEGDQDGEDFYYTTHFELSPPDKAYDCIILFREAQRHVTQRHVVFEIPDDEPFDPRKIRWEYVSHDSSSFPNDFLYESRGMVGEGFISNFAYGEQCTRDLKSMGQPHIDGVTSNFEVECDGEFRACIILVRRDGEWELDTALANLLADQAYR
jgi:hypothetical protein